MSKILASTITVTAVLTLAVAGMGGAVFAQSSPTCGPLDNGRVADVVYKESVIFFDPIVRYEYQRAVLTISGPCENIVKTFKPGEQIFFDLGEVKRTLDGPYTWQLRFTPVVDPEVQENLRAARGTGEEEDLWWYYWQKGSIPAGPSVDSAAFSVVEGRIIDPSSGEESQKSAALAERSSVGRLTDAAIAAAPAVSERAAAQGIAGAESGGNRLSPKDFVINDDLIVDGSACIGFDCVNGESFGFDTIRLKENNLRIKFDDTSTAASFPRNDWQITVNDSANGGASKFSIDDISGSRTPFTIEANAPSHSLYVDDGGRVGFGTSTPSVELHTIDGDTPTLRLQQDGSSGFAPQTWDVAGNETNFFVRDVTNGSTLPFRIFPGASSNSLVIDDTDDIGMGTSSPSASLHVKRTSGNVTFELETAASATAQFNMVNSGGEWQMIHGAGGAYNLNRVGVSGNQFVFSPNGNLDIQGTLTTGGPSCGGGCDRVFEPGYELPSIDQHAALMWEEGHLPAVGPTKPGARFNVSEKTGAILNELEKAHIYIEQLHHRLAELEKTLAELQDR